MSHVSPAEAAVREQAARECEEQNFNSKCVAVEVAGSEVFGPKWAKAKQDLAMLDDNGRIPPDILRVALETQNPARVLFELSKDLEKADELMGMTPIKRAIAMDKIASSEPAERQQSKAPLPLEQSGGKGARDDRPRDTDTDEEWNRKEELRERKKLDERRRSTGR